MQPNSTTALELPEMKRETDNISPILFNEGFNYILSVGKKKGKRASYVFLYFLPLLLLTLA